MYKFIFQGNAKIHYLVNHYWDNTDIFNIDEELLDGYINEESTCEFKIMFNPIEEIYYETVIEFTTVLGMKDLKVKGTGNELV